jgi:hypothetical protein
MRNALAPLLVAVALICASASVAVAATITIAPSGNIVATIRGLGFEPIVFPLFTCDVVLSGSMSPGPITLVGRVGSISGVRISSCSGGHVVVAKSLPWSLTGQTALACPSASTGLLGTLPARFVIDEAIETNGSVGVLMSSGANPFAVLASRLSSGVQVLPGGGTYTQVQTIRCA